MYKEWQHVDSALRQTAPSSLLLGREQAENRQDGGKAGIQTTYMSCLGKLDPDVQDVRHTYLLSLLYQ